MMKQRTARKKRVEMNGWPNTRTWRDEGSFDPYTGTPCRMTAGRCSMQSIPRAAWRVRPLTIRA